MSQDAFTIPSSNPNPNANPYQQQPLPPAKKKRNLPGTPDPDAEVIALSPKSLMATNRFVCEICNKGFQRDQNLQLHRRGHNLPWKLRQRVPGVDVRRKVYICPEPACVHHNPSRALGDLTGIKKHFSRKHGEKKWKCDRCSKKYAVRSDWKAHSKTCGTREYKCDCGTIFSRKDSFITHRAFCDALTQESSRLSLLNYTSEDKTDNSMWLDHHPVASDSVDTDLIDMVPMTSNNNASFSPTLSAMDYNNKGGTMTESLSSLYSNSQFGSAASTAAHLSATALLQKAAQMGATMSKSSSSLFGGLMSSPKSRIGQERAMGGFQDLMMNNVSRPMMGMTLGPQPAALGETRDFLGLGAGEGSGQAFQELAKFGYMGSGVDLI